MLSAEFGYSIDHIDEYMDIPLFEGCLRYRDFSPPIGALFKAFCDAMEGGGGGMKMGYNKSTSQRQTTPENSLSDFAEAFGGFGGMVTVK